jgi:hypothetical protein
MIASTAVELSRIACNGTVFLYLCYRSKADTQDTQNDLGEAWFCTLVATIVHRPQATQIVFMRLPGGIQGHGRDTGWLWRQC